MILYLKIIIKFLNLHVLNRHNKKQKIPLLIKKSCLKTNQKTIKITITRNYVKPSKPRPQTYPV